MSSVEQPFIVHALSALHSGTGQSADIIDLPISRMKATGMPFVPGSSIKGVLRNARSHDGGTGGRFEAVFGPGTSNASEHAGALVVSDARLLAMPVRSYRGTFAWVTSPMLLKLAARDGVDGGPLPIAHGQPWARYATETLCAHENKLYLEDIDLEARQDPAVQAWAQRIGSVVFPGDPEFAKRFVVVDDETMTFLWETATQVDARVRISENGTVENGALWLEESLPSETLLVGILMAERSRKKGTALQPDEVLAFALPRVEIVQLGGKATVGRGRCRLVPVGDSKR